LGQTNSGPSVYYDVDFNEEDEQKEAMETDALADPVAFAWESDSVNIYITRYGGANWNVCSFPGDDHIIILNGNAGYATARLVLHEIGHYFDLRHTFSGEQYLNADNTSCTNNDCSCAAFIGGGNDDIDDTKLDHRCWDTRNEVAQGNFGLDENQLNASQSTDVDRIWRNIMSYHDDHHPDIDTMTPDQLDRWSDTANGFRSDAVTGHTWYVDVGDPCWFALGNSKCVAFGGPFPTVAEGISAAGSSDIVLIRGGIYNEVLTLDTPIQLRASRGNAIIR
jgi:hypothetical protein